MAALRDSRGLIGAAFRGSAVWSPENSVSKIVGLSRLRLFKHSDCWLKPFPTPKSLVRVARLVEIALEAKPCKLSCPP